uniref:C-type lectin domain-containing protein n=1 Tax=Ascaris lumbricoides TaxID=6252 RepID=A0A9J2PDS5_ASCLU
MSEEGSTRVEEVDSQRKKSQRSQSPVGGWSWSCFSCWRKQKPAPDPSGGALPRHWLDPNNKNFRTTWTKEDHRASTRCSVANDDILVDKTESVTEMQTDDSGPCPETSVTADTSRRES